MAVRDAGAVQRLRGPARFFAESGPSLIGPITLGAKHAGERSAGNPPATFDVAGAGNVTAAAGPASAKTLEHPTCASGRRTSPRPYVRPAKAGLFSRRLTWLGRMQK